MVSSPKKAGGCQGGYIPQQLGRGGKEEKPRPGKGWLPGRVAPAVWLSPPRQWFIVVMHVDPHRPTLSRSAAKAEILGVFHRDNHLF